MEFVGLPRRLQASYYFFNLLFFLDINPDIQKSFQCRYSPREQQKGLLHNPPVFTLPCAPSPGISACRAGLAPSVHPSTRPSVRAAGAGRAPRACQGQMVFASGARSQLSAARRDARGSCRRSRRCQTRGICCARPYTCPWAAAARRRLEGRRKIAAPSGRNLMDKQQRRNPQKMGKKNKN